MLNDIRLAFRALRAHPSVAWPALLTLALGIGATTAIFSVVYGVLVRLLPLLGVIRSGGRISYAA